MKLSKIVLLALAFGFAATSVLPDAEAQVRRTTKSTRKKKRKKPVVVKKPPVGKVDPLNAPMVGTWFTIDANGVFAKANKFVFAKTGEFNYIGPGFKSGGTFSLRTGIVNLSWTQIDGAAVKTGTVKKSIPVTPERTFKIDRFTYKFAL